MRGGGGRTRTRVMREGARDRAIIGERDGKVGRNEKKVGEGGEVWEDCGVNGSKSGDKGGAGREE